jgi:hypothetical protein
MSAKSQPAASPLTIDGNLAFGGSVTVAPQPGVTLSPGTYLLYTYTGALAGTPVFTFDAPGFAASFDTSVTGQVSMTVQASALPPGNLLGVAGDGRATLSWTASPTASSYTVLRSTTREGPFTSVIAGLTSLSHTDLGLTNGRTYTYIVRAISSDGASADSTPASVSVGSSAPHASWRFDQNNGSSATDSSGNSRHAALVNTPTWTAGRLNNGLSFASASSHHATLPSGVVSTLNDFTLSVWVRMTTLANWARIVDFGTGTTNYLFLAPRASTGFPRFALRTATVGEQSINGTVALPTGTWTHLAVTLSGSTGTLYVNGVAVGTNPAMTLTPASLGVTTQNYFGRSQFSADLYLNGALDELQIHARALTAAEVATLAAPPAAPASLTATAGTQQIALSWPPVSGATGYSIKRSATSGGPYATVATSLTGLAYTDTGLTNGTPVYYVVTTLKDVAESAWSAQAYATPVAPLSPVESWRVTHFGSASATDDAADTADPVNDGVANLLEYALGGNPLAPDSARLPTTALTLGIPPSLVLFFDRVADPGITYRVQASSNLSSGWTEIWSSTGDENTAGPIGVTDPAPTPATGGRFLRLEVTSP